MTEPQLLVVVEGLYRPANLKEVGALELPTYIRHLPAFFDLGQDKINPEALTPVGPTLYLGDIGLRKESEVNIVGGILPEVVKYPSNEDTRTLRYELDTFHSLVNTFANKARREAQRAGVSHVALAASLHEKKKPVLLINPLKMLEDLDRELISEKNFYNPEISLGEGDQGIKLKVMQEFVLHPTAQLYVMR